ncbi:MAG: hypothetical protein C0404_06980, partial [Verrucomicrobia bacterium]|nr:hypothetical protein [Verrucomicrobiota bacterium]
MKKQILLHAAISATAWALAAVVFCAAIPGVAADAPVWETRPSLETIYTNYAPSFSRGDGSSSEELKYSRQPNFMSVADVQMDSQVKPIIEKANETADQKKDYRKASELYRRIIQEFPEELFQIAPEGIFIPSSLYAQLKILMYPKKELAYYRILFDPTAKEIYERAVKRYSIFDYKDLARYHLSTSYGDDALFALGNAAIDNGQYDEARRCYEQLLAYHGMTDDDSDDIKLDRDQVLVRLAICYKYLGREAAYKQAAAKVARKDEPTVAKLMVQLEKFKYDEFGVRQREGRRSPIFDAMDDKSLADPMPYQFPANRGEWEAKLGHRPLDFPRCAEPDVLPWATENDLIYKDMNILYSRSLLTGAMNWVFGPGGSSFDWDRFGGNHHRTSYNPSQAILVHDGVVFAAMFVYGPSLVAVDQFTGQQLWAKGPMAAQTEDDWLDRYQAAPAAGRGMVVAPVVHDDIRGRSHISSSADLAAFDSRSGKLLWRTTLSRISPLKITQSRYPRKIRILSTSPIIKDGIVYHVSNAGVIAAIDARSGNVVWLTRYSQRKDVLDNFASLQNVWRNESPLIRGSRLYVTPVDSNYLLCLDKETGRVLWDASMSSDSGSGRKDGRRGGFSHVWHMAGFTPDGKLCLSGNDIVFLDPETGTVSHGVGLQCIPGMHGADIIKLDKTKVAKGLEPGLNGEGDDFWYPLGHVHQPPTITMDGKIYFGMQEWNGEPGPRQAPFNSDYVYDTAKRSIIAQRRWYDPVSYISTFGYANALPTLKRPVNEEPASFDPAMRFSIKRWQVPFEADIKFNSIVMRYDQQKLNAVLTQQKTLETIFAQAEVARRKGDVRGAIALYEACKPLLPSEEEDRRRNINLRLYPLYSEVARWGHQAADYAMLEDSCRKMGATASNPAQEIRALLAYAELHEKKGAWLNAVQVMQNASRHYWREALPTSGLELGDRAALMKLAEDGLERLLGEIPDPYRDDARQVLVGEKAALADYWLAVADVDSDFVVETRGIMSKRLRELLKRAPADFRRQYEKDAEEELRKYEGWQVGERLLWCWPETEAGRKKLKELESQLPAGHSVDKQAQIWKLADLASACGFGEDIVKGGKDGLARVSYVNTMEPGANFSQIEGDNGDTEIVRLTLPQKGQVKETSHLMFVGGRKKSAYGNKFTVSCFNMKENKKDWETREILLYG